MENRFHAQHGVKLGIGEGQSGRIRRDKLDMLARSRREESTGASELSSLDIQAKESQVGVTLGKVQKRPSKAASHVKDALTTLHSGRQANPLVELPGRPGEIEQGTVSPFGMVPVAPMDMAAEGLGHLDIPVL
jgi:hypothetical protein